jgi:hypothetical protein
MENNERDTEAKRPKILETHPRPVGTTIAIRSLTDAIFIRWEVAYLQRL